MIFYVESNFILECAYQQEEHESCGELLAMAEAGQISLVIPAFSMIEVRQSINRRAARRKEVHDRLQVELKELSRSPVHNKIASTFYPLTTALIETGKIESNQLKDVLTRIGACGRILPIQLANLMDAVGFESRFNLSPQDALILATILDDLSRSGEGTKYFLNRNSNDFANPDIGDALGRYGCILLPSFHGGAAKARK